VRGGKITGTKLSIIW